jgi:imidazole glycerol-phosphate synthase subunit HisH
MIALIDYKAGNLTSVRKALAAVGAEVFTPETPSDLSRARALIVPGVGHFAATRALDDRWMETIRQLVGDGRPLLGICLGMQWLFETSDEAPDIRGLGVLSGRCYRLGRPLSRVSSSALAEDVSRSTSTGLDVTTSVKVPHVGWNALQLRGHAPILEGVPDRSQVYFTHSYVAPITVDTAAATDHGETFASVVQRDNVAGVQFHPEKSGEVGLRILHNWLRTAS